MNEHCARCVLRGLVTRIACALTAVMAIFASSTAFASSCPDGSTRPLFQPTYRFGDNFYRLTACKDNWANAQTEAQRQRGNLTSILNMAENQWIFSRFGRPELGKLLWIGLSGTNWIDGSGSATSNFVNTYPIAAGTTGCSGALLGTLSSFSGGWVMQTTSCPAVQTTKYGIIKIPAASACLLDVDGDGQFTAAVDALAWTRVMAGFNGTSVGESLAPVGSEATGAAISSYLRGTATPNVFGSATSPARSPKASSDGLVLIRLLQGMSDAQLLNNIPIPLGAPNFSAAQIRQSINALCGADL